VVDSHDESPPPLPADLPPGEAWASPCGLCPALIQQGLYGLRAHWRTVHPDIVPDVAA
jgi:hypothetical protein